MARELKEDGAVITVREDELDLNVPPDPDAVYQVRIIPPKDYERIRKEHIPMIWDRRTHRQVEGEQTPDQAQAMTSALLDLCLVDWSGVSEKGQAVPCDSPARKMKLPRPVRVALVELALTDGATKQDRRRESFREPPRVGAVLDRSQGPGDVLSDRG